MKNTELLEQIVNGIELDPELESELVDLGEYEDGLMEA